MVKGVVVCSPFTSPGLLSVDEITSLTATGDRKDHYNLGQLIDHQGHSWIFAMQAGTSSRSLFPGGYIIISNYQKHGLLDQAVSTSKSSRKWGFFSPSVIHIQQVAFCLDKWFLSLMDELFPGYHLSPQLIFLTFFAKSLLCHNLQQVTRKPRLYDTLLLCSTNINNFLLYNFHS